MTWLSTPQHKWKKPDKSATLLDVCTVGKARSSTCDRLYETGVTALAQTLFIFMAALTMFIANRSSGELTNRPSRTARDGDADGKHMQAQVWSMTSNGRKSWMSAKQSRKSLRKPIPKRRRSKRV